MIVVLARKTMGGSNNVISSDKERWIKAEEDHRENCFTDADYPVDKDVIAQVSLLLNNASRKKRDPELVRTVELVFQLQWNRFRNQERKESFSLLFRKKTAAKIEHENKENFVQAPIKFV